MLNGAKSHRKKASLSSLTLSFIYACLLTYYSKLICCCQQLNCIYIFINARTLRLSPTANSSRCILVGDKGFGLGGKIRTYDLSAPNGTRYQASLHRDSFLFFVVRWLGRQDSNLHSTVPKTVALPIKLLPNNF